MSSLVSSPPPSLFTLVSIKALTSSLYDFSKTIFASVSCVSSGAGNFFCPTFLTSWSIPLIIFCVSLWAFSILAITTFSGTCNAPASIMTVLSLLCETTISSSESSIWGDVGLTMYASEGFSGASSEWVSVKYPMRVAPIGPFQGIREIAIAAETAFKATISGSFSPSTERTVTITWTWFLKAFGKSGLMDRSIRRPASVASSDGRPSLLTQRLPLILPPA